MFDQLGRALRILREQAGLSQTHVAREAGMGKSRLSAYENGKELPKLDSLARLLRVLEVRPLWLFYLVELLDRSKARESLPPAALLQAGAAPFLEEGEEAAFRSLFDQLLGFYGRSIEARALAAAGRSAVSPPERAG